MKTTAFVLRIVSLVIAMTGLAFCGEYSQSEDPESPAYLPGYGPPVGHYNYEGMKRIGEAFAKEYLERYARDQQVQNRT